jgi:predicted esterase
MEHHFPVTRTARYFSQGKPSAETKHVWIVLHGYGQLASYFLRSFSSLDEQEHYVLAPEGPHRFYLSGFAGRVGASWMTKEDRLTDITDYVTYLDAFYKEVLQQFNRDEVTVNVLGFSQGAATVSRWISHGNSVADNFILWAGAFPSDVQFEINKPIFDRMNIFLLVGDADEFIKPERVAKERALLDENDVTYKFIPFEGPHKITPDALKTLVAHL